MEIPQNLDSKFRFILVAARRARQLQSGAKPLIQTPTKRSTRVAQQEVGRGTGADRSRARLTNGEKNAKKKAAK